MKPVLERMTLSELSRLVYRDHLDVKHSSRKRLSSEVTVKMNTIQRNIQACAPQDLSILGPEQERVKVDPLSKLLVKYLLEAHVIVTSQFLDKITLVEFQWCLFNV